jgi:predicted Mrr-cat superfamily restriction endonuclease
MRTITYSNNRFLNKLNHHINLKLLKLRGLDNRSNKLLNFDKWGNSLDLKKYFDDSFYSITPMLNNDELIKTLIDQYDKGSFEQKLAAYNCVKSYHKIFIGS